MRDGRIVEVMEVVGVEGSRVLFERYLPLHDTVFKTVSCSGRKRSNNTRLPSTPTTSITSTILPSLTTILLARSLLLPRFRCCPPGLPPDFLPPGDFPFAVWAGVLPLAAGELCLGCAGAGSTSSPELSSRSAAFTSLILAIS